MADQLTLELPQISSVPHGSRFCQGCAHWLRSWPNFGSCERPCPQQRWWHKPGEASSNPFAAPMHYGDDTCEHWTEVGHG